MKTSRSRALRTGRKWLRTLLSTGATLLLVVGCHRNALTREEARRQIQEAIAKSVESKVMEIDISNREITVTGLVVDSPNAWADFTDSFDWEKQTKNMSLQELSDSFSGNGKHHVERKDRARFQLYDDGWRLVSDFHAFPL